MCEQLLIVFGFTLWMTFLQGCSFQYFQDIKDSKADIIELVERQKLLENLESLSASGHLEIQTNGVSLSSSIEYQFNTIDTLNIQISDFLGRRLARIELSGDEYFVWLQRSGEFYSGIGSLSDFSDYHIPSLTAEDWRKLILGIFEIENVGRKDFVADGVVKIFKGKERKVQYRFAGNPIRLSEVLFLFGDEYGDIKVVYKEYSSVKGLYVPSFIMITGGRGEFLVKIHLSHFSTDLCKFAL